MSGVRGFRWVVAGIGLTLVVSGAAVGTTIDADGGGLSTSAGPSGPQGDALLPNLRMAPLYGIQIQATGSGRDRLRFGTIGWNTGEGPLEISGKRIPSGGNWMRVKQRIYEAGGGSHVRVSPALLLNDLDDQNHWDIRQFISIQLYTAGEARGDVYSMRKVGYCMLDSARMSNPPPGSPPSPVYRSCGTDASRSLVTGISVGHGDDYPPYWPLQWIDINGLPAGEYRICATIDPLGEFVESEEGDNQRVTDVFIDRAAGEVVVLGTTVTECGPAVP